MSGVSDTAAASPEAQPAQFPPITVAEDDDEAMIVEDNAPSEPIELQDPVAVGSPWVVPARLTRELSWVDAMRHDPSEDILFNLDAVIKLTEAGHPFATNVALAGIYSLLAYKGFGL